jgi:hypothetical protein
MVRPERPALLFPPKPSSHNNNKQQQQQLKWPTQHREQSRHTCPSLLAARALSQPSQMMIRTQPCLSQPCEGEGSCLHAMHDHRARTTEKTQPLASGEPPTTYLGLPARGSKPSSRSVQASSTACLSVHTNNQVTAAGYWTAG